MNNTKAIKKIEDLLGVEPVGIDYGLLETRIMAKFDIGMLKFDIETQDINHRIMQGFSIPVIESEAMEKDGWKIVQFDRSKIISALNLKL